jgi:3-oxoadipate enol-lactonase
LTPPAASAHLARQIPGARLHVIADAGHLSNFEKPAEFNAVLREFLLEPGMGSHPDPRRARSG